MNCSRSYAKLNFSASLLSFALLGQTSVLHVAETNLGGHRSTEVLSARLCLVRLLARGLIHTLPLVDLSLWWHFLREPDQI